MKFRSNNSEIEKQLKNSKKEIKDEVKKDKVSGKNLGDDSEPTLYHYLVVLFLLLGIFLFVYIGFEFFYGGGNGTPVEQGRFNTYTYEFEVGNRSGKMTFYNTIDIIEKLDYPIEVSKYDILESQNIYLSFHNYSGTDNGEVVRISGRFIPFFKGVFQYEIDPVDDLFRDTDLNCANSTQQNKVVIFDPYSDKTGVFMDENGCIMFLADDPLKMGGLGDKFYYTLINE